MTDYRKELVELYEQYNPSKLKDVNRLLITFKGREAIMLDTLRRKYILQETTTATAPEADEIADTERSSAPPSSHRAAHGSATPTPNKPRRTEQTLVVSASVTPTNEPVERMAQLLAQMSAVDLDALIQRVSSLIHETTPSPRSRWQSDTLSRSTASSAREAELFTHMLKFMQFFVVCAKEFLDLAQHETSAARSSSPAPASSEPPVHPHTAVSAAEPSSPPPRTHNMAESPAASASTALAHASHSPPASRARTKTPPSPSLDRPEQALVIAPPQPAPHARTEQIVGTPLTAEPSAGRTITLSPTSSNGGSSVMETAQGLLPLRAGDTVLLEPGHYSENITFTGAGRLTLRAAYPGTPVILHALRPTEPILRVKGADAEVTVSGLVFVGERPTSETPGALTADCATQYVADASLPAVPLVAISHRAQATLDGCHFYHCGTAAVTAVGAHTRLQLRLCLISLCAFAGAYAHRGGTIELIRSRVKCCEVGLRAASGGSMLQLSETTVESCATDGIVLHGASAAHMERSSVFNNKGNGALIASGGSLEVVDSTIELNVLYGVQRFRGSYLHLTHSFIRDNGVLPINDADD